MRKTISFSLWGNNPKYTVGAIKNAQLTEKYYKDWKLKFYIANDVPNQILYSLEEFKNVQIVEKGSAGDWTSMFWRFEACYDDDSDVVIFRDTDSRINPREEAAVKEWLESDKTFHIMRDHPYHRFPMLGGMWGIKKSVKYDMKSMLDDFKQNKITNRYGTDYDFLGGILYPLIKDDSVIHDEFFGGKPFPTKRENLQFVGQVFDQDDVTVEEHQTALKNSLV
jgi:hypothetical protein